MRLRSVGGDVAGPGPGADDDGDRGEYGDEAEPLVGGERLMQQDPAEQDGHQRIDIGVGGDQGYRHIAQQEGIGRVAHEGGEDGEKEPSIS